MYPQKNWARYCINCLNESNWYYIAVVVCHVESSYKPCAIKIHTTRSTGYIIFPVILKYNGIGDANKLCNANDLYEKKERVIRRQDTLTNRYRWCISRKCYDILVDKMISMSKKFTYIPVQHTKSFICIKIYIICTTRRPSKKLQWTYQSWHPWGFFRQGTTFLYIKQL